MKISTSRKTILCSLVLTGMIQPAMAGNFVSEQLISTTIWNPCTGEDVLLEGAMLLRGNNVANTSGGESGNYTENAKNIKAIGESSGESYTYKHNVQISVHKQRDGQLKVQHLSMDVALFAGGKLAAAGEAKDYVIKDLNMHYVFANDGSMVTSNIDYSQGSCE